MSTHESGCDSARSSGRWRALGRGAAALSLWGVLILAGSGCARQEVVQAADVTEAPVVTVRTLSTRTSPRKAQLVANQTAKSAVETTDAKPAPKPRRRRRTRPRPTPPPETRQPQAPVAAAAQDKGQQSPPPADTPAEPPKAATPEHVIEPRPPSREAEPAPQPTPEAPPEGIPNND